jgi:excisionase family DNA binding protein
MDDTFLREFNIEVDRESAKLGAAVETLDLYFLVYLRTMSRFGFFVHGPVVIDVNLIDEIVSSTLPRGATSEPQWSDDLVRFSRRLMDEVRRSGRRRIDELHFLLAFMRSEEGLPARVFGELGVTPEQVEALGGPAAGAADATSTPPSDPLLERLYSAEEAAEYLGVHVRTVRAWIRSGRLAARRLAGQRALRITASDLQSVLEPVGTDQDREAP